MTWSASKVYHFTLAWGGGNMSVNICESIGTNCVVPLDGDPDRFRWFHQSVTNR
jgi:hypothetical protein